MIEHREYYRKMFLASALWNWLAASGLLFGDPVMRAIGSAAPNFEPASRQLFAACVVVFGIGYYIVSRDISRNEGIVVIGIIGKLAVIALFGVHAALGDVPAMLAGAGLVDLIFAALFAEFLWRRRSEGVGLGGAIASGGRRRASLSGSG